jgi:hypothetical protein
MQPTFDTLSEPLAIGASDTLELLDERSRFPDHRRRFLASHVASQ